MIEGQTSNNYSSLAEAMLALHNVKEANNFMRDLMTEQEITELGKRWTAAQMLNQKIPYTKIVSKTGLSSTTIARISKWLTNGTGGYQMMLDRLAEDSHKHHASTH